MCQRVQCDRCGKPTYAGCGRHVEEVLGDVPPEKRCTCREDQRAVRDADQQRSLWQRLFGT